MKPSIRRGQLGSIRSPQSTPAFDALAIDRPHDQKTSACPPADGLRRIRFRPALRAATSPSNTLPSASITRSNFQAVAGPAGGSSAAARAPAQGRQARGPKKISSGKYRGPTHRSHPEENVPLGCGTNLHHPRPGAESQATHTARGLHVLGKHPGAVDRPAGRIAVERIGRIPAPAPLVAGCRPGDGRLMGDPALRPGPNQPAVVGGPIPPATVVPAVAPRGGLARRVGLSRPIGGLRIGRGGAGLSFWRVGGRIRRPELCRRKSSLPQLLIAERTAT